MKKFFLRSFLFITLGLTLFSVSGSYLISEAKFREVIILYDTLKLSKQKTHKNHLILGDSVGRQMVSRGLKELESNSLDLTNIQGASVIGQYILLKNVLAANPGQLKKVTLIYVPHAFSNNLDQPYTYSNLVMPFFTFEHLSDFSLRAWMFLARRPLFVLNVFPFFRASHFLSLDYSEYNPEPMPFEPFTKRKPYLSEISIEYLKKIMETCAREKIRFSLRGTPLSNRANLDFEQMKKQVSENGLNEVFKNYFEDITIVDDHKFSDSVHLKKEFLRAYSIQ